MFSIRCLFLSVPLCIVFLSISCGAGSGESYDNSNADNSQESSLLREGERVTLEDLWNGQAHFVPSGAGFGNQFLMHFLSVVENDGLFYAYFVNSPIFYERSTRVSTSLAVSNDGINFENMGEVLPVGDLLQVLDGQSDFSHQIGVADSHRQGWSSSIEHGSGFMAMGGRSLDLPQGTYTARFALTLLDRGDPEQTIATLEVFDQEAESIVSRRDIARSDFNDIGIETFFLLQFDNLSGLGSEFRIYSSGTGALSFSSLSIQVGGGSTRDERISSFPSVYKDGATWYMAYEGASEDSNGILGEVRLATSQDGYNWVKSPNPLVVPSAPWQSTNVGTPSLIKHRGLWYLFYHGFDGNRLQLGVASGPSLDSLRPLNNNQPVLGTGQGWDSGTIGKRSIVYHEPYFYMVYEGSTLEGDFSKADWGCGLARSSDLLNWEKFPGNPIIGPTSSAFGLDGPEFVRTADGVLHIYFRNMLGSSDRVSLTAGG